MFYRRSKIRSARYRGLRSESLESRRLLAGDSDVFSLFQTASLAVGRTAGMQSVGDSFEVRALPADLVSYEMNVVAMDAVGASPGDTDSLDLDFVEATTHPEATDPWVSIEPTFVDKLSQPVSSIMVGETVWLQVTIDDIGEFANRGIFSAYFDVDFGNADVMLAGKTEFNSGYSFLRRDPGTYGWQAIGAVDSNWFTPDPDAHWLVRIPVQFDSAGEVDLQLGAPENWVQYATLIYGNNTLTPVDAVDFGQISLTVIGNTSIVESDSAVDQTESDPPMPQSADQATDAAHTDAVSNQPLPLALNNSDDDDDNLPTDEARLLF